MFMTARTQTIPEKFLRQGVLAVFALGVAGVGIELVLTGHYEDWKQWIPIELLGVGLLAAVWALISRDGKPVLFMQCLGIAYVVAGFVGIYFHFCGNREFELEMYPSLSGFGLIVESLTGATPALAPGVMVQLGLLALLFVFRHPAKATGRVTSQAHARPDPS